MFRNQSASSHQFAMVPKSDVPRSKFPMSKTLKTTFDSGGLVPIMVEPVLPGDTFNVTMTSFARMATPIFPFMDNVYYETFFFFVPLRLVWTSFVRMMGEQDAPGDSISYTVPQLVSTVGGYAVGSIYDQMGLPCAGQVGGGATYSHSVLPLRCYNLIYNKWFRDENLINNAPIYVGDTGDLIADYGIRKRGKRHDYFTSALPWVQKGNTSVSLPLGTSATVTTKSTDTVTGAGGYPLRLRQTTDGNYPSASNAIGAQTGTGNVYLGASAATVGASLYPANLYTDLSTATAATINQLRQAVTIQQLLEKDARGGTRYTETTRVHFGVVSPDARLQRPEYLGGGSTAISVNEVQQNTASAITGSTTPLGTLSATARFTAHHGFSQSFTEHGYIIGLACVRADLTYQQGLRRHWSYLTRYDFPYPVFANLGEQAILNKEIYLDGSANDALVFGYQERYGECRYNPSEIHGLFRSTSAGTIDPWHLAQKFTSLPSLNQTFIEESPPISRVVAVGAGANGQQYLLDAFFSGSVARALPTYGVPGLVRF